MSDKPVPPFAKKDEIAKYDLNGAAWSQHALGDAVAAAAQTLSGGALPIVVADFRVPHTLTAHAPEDEKDHSFDARSPGAGWDALPPALRAWLAFAHDALIVVDADGRKYFPTFAPSGESVAAQRIAPGHAFTVLEAKVLDSATEDKKTVLHALREVLGSMLHGHTLRAYKVLWGNNDDTDRTGVIAVDPHAGEVRAFVIIDPP
jgi:hypothetical protein